MISVSLQNKMANESIWDVTELSETSIKQPMSKRKKASEDTCVVNNCPLKISAIESFSDMKFNGGLRKAMTLKGFLDPNEVQKRTLPILLDDGKINVVLVAPREYGKTVTVLMTALEKLARDKSKTSPRIVMLCPQYDLAKKAYEVALELSRCSVDVSVGLVTRGTDLKKTKGITEDMIIGTSAKVYEAHCRGVLDLQKVETLIMDEAVDMVPVMNLSNDVTRICCQLSHCRFILCTTTKNENLSHFVYRFVRYPVEVTFSEKKHVRQIFLRCRDTKQKLDAMLTFVTTYKYPGQSVVICNKRETALQIVNTCALNLGVTFLGGGMKSKLQEEIIKKFDVGEIQILVMTPAFANSVSITNISTVFNFDLLLDDFSLNWVEYSRRANMIGRNKQGIVVNVVDENWASSLFPEGACDQFGKEIVAYEDMFKTKN